MKEYPSVTSYDHTGESVVTIGTFDGVHIGHRAILNRLVETARKEDRESVLLTFFPHPRMVLQKDVEIKLINTIDERKEMLAETGLDHLIIHPFTHEFSRLTAMEYVRDVLVNSFHARKIIIGYDHRFGRNRTADIGDLKEYGKTYSFEVDEISAQELDEVAVSSTKIRNALHEGDIETANDYLGYSFMLNGTVVKGKGMGRPLGFPTANLHISEEYKLIPKNGVYIVQASFSGKRVYGLTSIGTNPTVGGTQKTIETWFLDFDKDLYDQPLKIEFLTRIRDEEHFESVDVLKKAVANDEVFARNYILRHG